MIIQKVRRILKVEKQYLVGFRLVIIPTSSDMIGKAIIGLADV